MERILSIRSPRLMKPRHGHEEQDESGDRRGAVGQHHRNRQRPLLEMLGNEEEATERRDEEHDECRLGQGCPMSRWVAPSPDLPRRRAQTARVRWSCFVSFGGHRPSNAAHSDTTHWHPSNPPVPLAWSRRRAIGEAPRAVRMRNRWSPRPVRSHRLPGQPPLEIPRVRTAEPWPGQCTPGRDASLPTRSVIQRRSFYDEDP